MENGIHRGTELNNVKETWDQNEKIEKTGKTEVENIEASSPESEFRKGDQTRSRRV
jgi:hypothetical protein